MPFTGTNSLLADKLLFRSAGSNKGEAEFVDDPEGSLSRLTVVHAFLLLSINQLKRRSGTSDSARE